MLLYQILAYTIHEKILKKHHSETISFKISTSTLNEKFELSDELYSASDIQDNSEHILKHMEKGPIILQ